LGRAAQAATMERLVLIHFHIGNLFLRNPAYLKYL
jgi:hypothetical protein